MPSISHLFRILSSPEDSLQNASGADPQPVTSAAAAGTSLPDSVSALQARFPQGISDFETLRSQGKLYIDKSALLVDLINAYQDQGPVGIFRPEGFGKSLMLSSVYSLFRHGTAHFKGLKAETLWPAEAVPAKVLYLDLSQITAVPLTFKKDFLSYLKERLLAGGFELPQADISSAKALIAAVFKALKRDDKAVILIDNPDAQLLALLKAPRAFITISKALREFYLSLASASKGRIKFMLVTGLTPVTSQTLPGFKVQDISFENKWAHLLGFTASEMKTHFKDYVLNAYSRDDLLISALQERSLQRFIAKSAGEEESGSADQPSYYCTNSTFLSAEYYAEEKLEDFLSRPEVAAVANRLCTLRGLTPEGQPVRREPAPDLSLLEAIQHGLEASVLPAPAVPVSAEFKLEDADKELLGDVMLCAHNQAAGGYKFAWDLSLGSVLNPRETFKELVHPVLEFSSPLPEAHSLPPLLRNLISTPGKELVFYSDFIPLLGRTEPLVFPASQAFLTDYPSFGCDLRDSDLTLYYSGLISFFGDQEEGFDNLDPFILDGLKIKKPEDLHVSGIVNLKAYRNLVGAVVKILTRRPELGQCIQTAGSEPDLEKLAEDEGFLKIIAARPKDK